METVANAELSSSSKEKSQIEAKVDERPSSPIDCAICLDHLTDKSFTNSCLHMFCFRCLLAWSKIKPECPLCKQDFCSIIHNIRSMTDYDEYHVPPPDAARFSVYVNPDMGRSPGFVARAPHSHDFFANNAAYFSYRTTITSGAYRLPSGRPNNLLIQPYVDNLELLADYPRAPQSLTTPPQVDRKEVYLRELETLPLRSTGRYRECCPTFYRENEAQIHRLIPWIQRELLALSQITDSFSCRDALRAIIDTLPVYHINSMMFINIVARFIGRYSERFAHELHRFATSPFEMDQYDRDSMFVHRRSDSHLSFIVTVGSDDSENVQVIPNTANNSSTPWIDVSDIHRVPPPVSRLNLSSLRQSSTAPTTSAQRTTYLPITSPVSESVIDISDSDDDDDCVIIGPVPRGDNQTIVLDDSEDEHSDVRVASPPTLLTTPSSSISSRQSAHKPVTIATMYGLLEKRAAAVKRERNGRAKRVVEQNSTVPTVPTRRPSVSSCCSSVISTDPSTDECSTKESKKRFKRKHTKKHYDTKRASRIPEVYTVIGTDDETEPDVSEDSSDATWEVIFNRRNKKGLSSKKRERKFGEDIRNVPNGHRLHTVDDDSQTKVPVLRLRRNRSTLKSGRNSAKTSTDSVACSCNDRNQYPDEPSTSNGTSDRHRYTCPFYSLPPITRNIYSSDSD